MRVVYREQDAATKGQIPDFLKSELSRGTWEPTGFDVDFPALVSDPTVIATLGYVGKSFLENSVCLARWYNRDTGIMVGSVLFSEECEGPPATAHGGAVASALDDILGTMVWREMGFSKAGFPTVQLNVSFRGSTPLGRQLRFDTYILEQEGRKVTAKAVLRDPASGQVLAEGEGLFYARKPPPPQVAPSPSPDGLRGKTVGGRTAEAPVGGPLAPSPPPSLPSLAPLPKLHGTHPEVNKRTRPKTEPLKQAGTKSYDDALREFGRGNPNAVANLLAFHNESSGNGSGSGRNGDGGSDDTPFSRRSKL
eukprot:jgi/Undpi1/3675/HiC_scaffold_16.g07045.m1